MEYWEQRESTDGAHCKHHNLKVVGKQPKKLMGTVENQKRTKRILKVDNSKNKLLYCVLEIFQL